MHREVLAWFEENKRDLPWRKSTPWGVLVSEFMLQQTPVNRVLPIWIEWMERWPTPEDLASAKKSELLKAWGRLGYPRRALRLHESATIIAKEFNNHVPQSIEELRTKVDKIPYLEDQIRDLNAKLEKTKIDTDKKV
jgi:A/G-specific adenine glycosylase